MAFHAEIRGSHAFARAFNLGEVELRRTVLDRWSRGAVVELGDREWDPANSRLTVLEGPQLAPPDLAMGQGWQRAERSARDVTAQVLAAVAPAPGRDASAVAVLATEAESRRVAAETLAQLGLRAVEWAAVRARIMTDAMVVSDGPTGGPGVAAAVIVVEQGDPGGAWLFEAGIALGALGSSAILAQVGTEPPPPELQGLGVIRLGDDPSSLHALAERLRRAGCAVGPVPG